MAPVTSLNIIILSLSVSETYRVSSVSSINRCEGFFRVSVPLKVLKLITKFPAELKTDIESVSILDTKIFWVDFCVAIPCAEPRYSGLVSSL